MPTFMMSMNLSGYWRYQRRPEARRSGALSRRRSWASRSRYRYLTSGESDLVVFVEKPNGDNVAKFALASAR